MKALAVPALLLTLGGCASAQPTAQAPSSTAPADSGSSPAASASPDTAAAPAVASSTPPAASDVPPAGAPPAAAAPLTIVPMKLAAPKLGHKVEVKGDGTVVIDGKPSWKITGTGLVDIKHPDQSLLAVAGDGTVTGVFVEAKDQMHFDGKDNLVDSGGGLAIGDDGAIALSDKAKADFGDMKLTGFAPSARRAASLVVAQILMTAAMEKAFNQMKSNLKKGQH